MPTHFAVTLSPTVAQQALATCAGLEQLQQLPYVRAILAESLRLYPQPPILIRRALADDVLPTPLGGDPKGYPIGKGADIFISVWNLHRWDGFSFVTACNHVHALLWLQLLTGSHMPFCCEVALVNSPTAPHGFAFLVHHLHQSVLCFVASQADDVPHKTPVS